MLVGPAKVVRVGLVKSTWNFHKLTELTAKFIKKFGEPVGEYVVPSKRDICPLEYGFVHEPHLVPYKFDISTH